MISRPLAGRWLFRVMKIRQCELVSVPWRGSNFFMVQCLKEMPRIFPSPDGALIVSKAAYMFISTFGFPSPGGALFQQMCINFLYAFCQTHQICFHYNMRFAQSKANLHKIIHGIHRSFVTVSVRSGWKWAPFAPPNRHLRTLQPSRRLRFPLSGFELSHWCISLVLRSGRCRIAAKKDTTRKILLRNCKKWRIVLK